jgi:hypothetical protein
MAPVGAAAGAGDGVLATPGVEDGVREMVTVMGFLICSGTLICTYVGDGGGESDSDDDGDDQ